MPPIKRNPIAGYIINHRIKQRTARQKAGNPIQPPHAKKPRIEAEPVEPDVSDDSTPDKSTDDSNSYSPDSVMDDVMLNDDAGVSNMDTLGTTKDAGGSAGGGKSGGGSASGVRGMVELWGNNRQAGQKDIRVYKKQYHFRLINGTVETAAVNGHTSSSTGAIRYPFHDIPVHLLGFYLSQAEIHQLSQYTEVKVLDTSCNVYNKTGCLNFETASSISSIGNNNVGIYMCQLDPSINKKRTGRLPSQQIMIQERCWGNPYLKTAQSNTFQTDNAHLGAQYVRRRLDNKFEYTYMNIPDIWPYTSNSHTAIPFPAGKNLPFFNPLSFVVKRKNVSFDEGLFTTWSYKPKDGLIFGQYVNTWNAVNNAFANTYSLYKRNIPLVETHQEMSSSGVWQPPANPSGTSVEHNAKGFNVEAMTMNRYLNYTPDYYSYMTIDNEMLNGTHRPPVLVIGIEPLVTELNEKWEAVNAYVDITIDTFCTIELTQGVDYINSNTRSTIVPNYMFPRYNPTVYDSTNVPHPLRAYGPSNDSEAYDSNAIQAYADYYADPNTYNPVLTYPAPTAESVSKPANADFTVEKVKAKHQPSYREVRLLRSAIRKNPSLEEHIKHANSIKK